MPPPLLFDLDQIDLSQTCLTQEQIYQHLPHRHEFMLLENVCYVDCAARQIVAYRDIRPGDWWFRGHVPGRPLLPGVLMLEMAAQLSAVLAKLIGDYDGFIGFGGIDQCKFRDTVVAGQRLYLICVGSGYRPRRIISETQGVVEGKIIFEARITGMILPPRASS